jgi:hypothetical protein
VYGLRFTIDSPRKKKNARKITVMWLVLEHVYFVGEVDLCMLEVVG